MEMSDLKDKEAAADQLVHGYGFDPTHGYRFSDLLAVDAPHEPKDYGEFWEQRHAAALEVRPNSTLKDTGRDRDGSNVFDWCFASTSRTEICG